MNEPVWYYAQGGTEKGPLTTSQTKSLVAAGKIRPDDLVWRQGMDDWVAARELLELFPGDEATATVSPRVDHGPRRRVLDADKRPSASALTRTMTVLGLLIVLGARGCDSLARRNLARLEAIPIANKRQFQDAWDGERVRIESRLAAGGESAAEAVSVKRELEALNETNKSRMQQLESGEWRRQLSAAEAARTDDSVSGYWREVAFLLGSFLLVVGLSAAAFSPGSAPDRWLSIALLAVIVHALFIGARP